MPPLRSRGQDIILLFRLFAMQMAERYHLPKITLTDEAKAVMLKYKWPGNVRQLKNITEQMSVLSPEREISAEMLQRYIPTDPESTQLAVIQKDGNHSYESERELLYKILYELRGNVTDLRRELNSVRKQMEEVRDLNGAAGFTAGTIAAVSNDNMPASIATSNDSQHRADNVEDAIAEEISEPESLNLNDVQRTMLEKALERNNGNRKKAAKELGISDRTLYRKLRQYSDDK
jgi:DNA-binding NtrC family response regulator